MRNATQVTKKISRFNNYLYIHDVLPKLLLLHFKRRPFKVSDIISGISILLLS